MVHPCLHHPNQRNSLRCAACAVSCQGHQPAPNCLGLCKGIGIPGYTSRSHLCWYLQVLGRTRSGEPSPRFSCIRRPHQAQQHVDSKDRGRRLGGGASRPLRRNAHGNRFHGQLALRGYTTRPGLLTDSLTAAQTAACSVQFSETRCREPLPDQGQPKHRAMDVETNALSFE